MSGTPKSIAYFALGFCLFFVALNDAQGQRATSPCSQIQDSVLHKVIYTNLDKMPEPAGGVEALLKILSHKLKHPAGDIDYFGKTIVAFVVEANGKISGKRVVKDPSGKKHIFSDQILDIISKVKWKPGSCNKKPVPSLYILPVYIDTD